MPLFFFVIKLGELMQNSSENKCGNFQDDPFSQSLKLFRCAFLILISLYQKRMTLSENRQKLTAPILI